MDAPVPLLMSLVPMASVAGTKLRSFYVQSCCILRRLAIFAVDTADDGVTMVVLRKVWKKHGFD